MNKVEIGKTEETFDMKYLIMCVANSLRNSGSTCDEDSWPEVMAYEAVRCLNRMGALK